MKNLYELTCVCYHCVVKTFLISWSIAEDKNDTCYELANNLLNLVAADTSGAAAIGKAWTVGVALMISALVMTV